MLKLTLAIKYNMDKNKNPDPVPIAATDLYSNLSTLINLMESLQKAYSEHVEQGFNYAVWYLDIGIPNY